jgi:single-stranded DNA-binding protein
VNSVALIGRLTADPQSHAGEKHESATFRLAVPRLGSDSADFVDISPSTPSPPPAANT